MSMVNDLLRFALKRESSAAESLQKKRAKLLSLLRAGERSTPKPAAVDEADRLIVELGVSTDEVRKLSSLFKREAELDVASASLPEAQAAWKALGDKLTARFVEIEKDTTARYLTGVLENGQFAPLPELWRSVHSERESAYVKLQTEMSVARSRVMLARRAPSELAKLKSEHPDVFGAEGGVA